MRTLKRRQMLEVEEEVVTLSPVFDTKGVYRYSIGILADSERAVSDGNALQALRDALPEQLDANQDNERDITKHTKRQIQTFRTQKSRQP